MSSAKKEQLPPPPLTQPVASVVSEIPAVLTEQVISLVDSSTLVSDMLAELKSKGLILVPSASLPDLSGRPVRPIDMTSDFDTDCADKRAMYSHEKQRVSLLNTGTPVMTTATRHGPLTAQPWPLPVPAAP